MNFFPSPFFLSKYLPRQIAPGRVATAVVLTLIVSGCASFGDVAPRAKIITPESAQLASATATWPDDRWWERYDDNDLNALITQALAESPGIKLTEARLRRALADAGVAESHSKLQVNGQIDSTYERFSEYSVAPPSIGGTRKTMNSANLNLSFALDFFGRNRALVDAALGQADAVKIDGQLARVTLASTIAKTYFNLARLLEQRGLVAESLELREQTRSLVQGRVLSGLDTNVELRQAEGNLPAARLEIAQLNEQIDMTRNQLAVLAGSVPGSMKTIAPKLALASEQTLPDTLPAELLGRRADLTAARLRANAATRSIDATKAAFYPNINLVAFAGFGSIGLSRWIDAGSAQYGVGPAITIPIFSGGRLRATLAGNSADYDSAVETYNQVLLDAIRDVSDQISSTQSVAVQVKEQRDAQAAIESAYALARQRYQAGLTNYLVVLTAENAVLAQRRQAIDLKARTLDLNVNLNRALGGGFVAEQRDMTSEKTRTTAVLPSATGSGIPAVANN
jgi:NodT family efflux transporter outer membrane factor (OMF) lipoprotein